MKNDGRLLLFKQIYLRNIFLRNKFFDELPYSCEETYGGSILQTRKKILMMT